MLAQITLENFRCFKRHTFPLRETTIVVGQNNAGKSTLVEALRLVSIVAERYRTVPYGPAPRWLELHRSIKGISPSLDNQAFNFEKVFHRHGDPPATVTALFSNGVTITVHVGPNNSIFAVIRNAKKRALSSKGDARSVEIGSVGALPQIAPVRYPEPVLDEDYVRKCLSSTLAPLHFRNQLKILYEEHFRDFKEISEATWHGLRVGELRTVGRMDRSLELEVRNEDFVADVSWMGHGLQMWLQTMWFLARCKNYDTVILDEPDVYMHADLQRKLIRFVKDRHRQVIIATHSVEIMVEVDPEDILVVDKEKREAKFAADLPEVQQIISHIGGVHNLSLARLVHAQKCLMVEGDDLELLRRFQTKLFPRSENPIDGVPCLPIGGWGGWNYVIGSSMWLARTMGDVSVYCVLDHDYHTQEQVGARLVEAQSKGIRLTVWTRKEIENYLLEPALVHRTLSRLSRDKGTIPSSAETESKMNELAETLRQETIDNYATEIANADKKLAVKSANEAARALVEGCWTTFGGRMSVVSGKSMLSELNRWTQSTLKLSFTPTRLASEMLLSEVHGDIRSFLTAFEFNEPV